MNKIAIGINAPHGGKDPGAVSNGIIERDAAWVVTKEIHRQLQNLGFSSNILNTPAENLGADYFAVVAQRAHRWGADMVISPHLNAGNGVGYDILHQVSQGLDDTYVACLEAEFKALGQVKHRVFAKPLDGNASVDWYGLLRECKKRSIPAVIGEFAFIDNAVDRQKVDTDIELQLVAIAYVKAICRMCDTKYTLDKSPEQDKPISSDATVNNMIIDGITTPDNKKYWEDVLSGKDIPRPEYIRIILDRYHSK